MAKNNSQETPMMQQYWKYREELPDDALLLFRLGDFYEMFHRDAEEGARILGITLTKRQNYPMAGIPYHAANNYIPKLLEAGRKVAIVDQVETPQPGKLVRRALTRILTPGTTLDENQLDARRNHFLLALGSNKRLFFAAWADLSTGEFQIAAEENPLRLLPLFSSIDPREIILPEGNSTSWAHLASTRNWHGEFESFCRGRPVTFIADFHFDSEEGARLVRETLGVLNLDGFGIGVDHPALGAAGALINYATENLCASPGNLRKISLYQSGESLLLDPATLRNLEIFKSAQNVRQGSLIDAIDHTATAGGARLLETWLATPSRDRNEIRRRQQAVRAFLEAPGNSADITRSLQHVRDLHRILGRLQNRIRNPRELGGIRDTLNQLPAIRAGLAAFVDSGIAALRSQIQPFDELRERLARAVADELPSNLQEGGVIRDGYDDELDRLRALTRGNKTWISDLERAEQQASGIKNLKIKYNGAFGYFIEVTKSNLASVPDHYIRKQTMVNAERYVTEELRQKEKEILHAEEQAIAHEATLFRQLTNEILTQADALGRTADALAQTDLFIGWSRLAREWDYCQPEVDESGDLEIEQGRHPVVEQTLKTSPGGLSGSHSFVPNDTFLSADDEQIAVITGPNMAGKSTYIRQVALMALLAQIGCWVPAKRCRLGMVDRVFSRVGASDELARGNSTFMVEMNETANILNHATANSLVILDEIGRGTSTYDGLSIAWAVVEHLHRDDCAGPRTLFATHYHELTQLEDSLPRLRNYCVRVKEWNDEIIFVRQVIPGAADRSYGIQVARLAGIPLPVITRAKVILDELEAEGNILRKTLTPKNAPSRKKTSPENQLQLF